MVISSAPFTPVGDSKLQRFLSVLAFSEFLPNVEQECVTHEPSASFEVSPEQQRQSQEILDHLAAVHSAPVQLTELSIGWKAWRTCDSNRRAAPPLQVFNPNAVKCGEVLFWEFVTY